MEASASGESGGAPGATTVLLVNTGTPQAPRPPAVRAYLRRFLTDRRVIELPRLLWLPLLYGVVLPTRSRRSARRYAQVWRADGAPLEVYTGQLRAALEQALAAEAGRIGEVQVLSAYLYSPPLITEVMKALRAQQVGRILVLPLYPQSSGTSTGAVYDQIGTALRSWRSLPALHSIAGYHNRSDYIDALAAQLREHWLTQAHTDSHLLISFHGIPLAYAARGDRYGEQCRETASLLGEALRLAPEQWTLSFQSRFGASRWLGPATDRSLRDLPRRGMRSVTVLCPGFAVDCLETLEEIALAGRAHFFAAGGERFDYVPALNASAAQVRLLTQMISPVLESWHGAALGTPAR